MVEEVEGFEGIEGFEGLRGMCNVNEYLINDLHLLYGKLLDQFLL